MMTVWASEAYSDTFPKAYAQTPETKIDIYKLLTYTPEELPEFPQGNPEPKPEPVKPKKIAYKPPVQSTECVKWMVEAGITDMRNATILINRESGCNPFAQNLTSSAYGIPQSLPGSKMASAGADWRTNPVTQLKWMQTYVISRYGSWANAVAFSSANNWY